MLGAVNLGRRKFHGSGCRNSGCFKFAGKSFEPSDYHYGEARRRALAIRGSAGLFHWCRIGYSVLDPHWMLGEPAVRINKSSASA